MGSVNICSEKLERFKLSSRIKMSHCVRRIVSKHFRCLRIFQLRPTSNFTTWQVGDGSNNSPGSMLVDILSNSQDHKMDKN